MIISQLEIVRYFAWQQFERYNKNWEKRLINIWPHLKFWRFIKITFVRSVGLFSPSPPPPWRRPWWANPGVVVGVESEYGVFFRSWSGVCFLLAYWSRSLKSNFKIETNNTPVWTVNLTSLHRLPKVWKFGMESEYDI